MTHVSNPWYSTCCPALFAASRNRVPKWLWLEWLTSRLSFRSVHWQKYVQSPILQRSGTCCENHSFHWSWYWWQWAGLGFTYKWTWTHRSRRGQASSMLVDTWSSEHPWEHPGRWTQTWTESATGLFCSWWSRQLDPWLQSESSSLFRFQPRFAQPLHYH